MVDPGLYEPFAVVVAASDVPLRSVVSVREVFWVAGAVDRSVCFCVFVSRLLVDEDFAGLGCAGASVVLPALADCVAPVRGVVWPGSMVAVKVIKKAMRNLYIVFSTVRCLISLNKSTIPRTEKAMIVTSKGLYLKEL